MPNSRNRHIHKYDPQRDQIIAIDSITGEEVAPADDRLTSLLKYLDGQNRSLLMRKFAIWCARQPDVSWRPVVYHMIRMAEEYLHGDSTLQELDELYRETEGMAISTDAVGLRRGNLHAPLFLISRACVNPDPYRAARDAARYHLIWSEMVQVRLYGEQTAEIQQSSTISTEVKSRQIDQLLELMMKEHR